MDFSVRDAMEKMEKVDAFLEDALEKIASTDGDYLILDVVERKFIERRDGFVIPSEKRGYRSDHISLEKLRSYSIINGQALREYVPEMGPYILVLNAFPYIVLDMCFILSDRESSEQAARIGEIGGIYSLENGRYIPEEEFISTPMKVSLMDVDGTLKEFNSIREMTEWVEQHRFEKDGEDKPIYH